jgi:hypothetical protein
MTKSKFAEKQDRCAAHTKKEKKKRGQARKYKAISWRKGK